jgi:hypothetical protein
MVTKGSLWGGGLAEGQGGREGGRGAGLTYLDPETWSIYEQRL